ncbi:MAG: archease [Candidatus Lokiarchaeota archaeon]|nr:archease [Candidatus Lokiarchaeota archaeon]
MERNIMSRGFKYHEHTADIIVECWAPTLEEAFAEAGLATYEVILDTSTVEPRETIELEAEGIDLQELLVEWVGRLIALIDIEGMFYSRFEVIDIKQIEDEYHLNGRAYGESINHDKHDTRTEVKAMTYAGMKIDETPEQTRIWFTLDL